MKKYRARTSFRWSAKAEITTVEVERETDHNVWINGRRHNKRSEYDDYFDSFDQAKSALLHCQNSINSSTEKQLKEGIKTAKAISNLLENE